MRKYFAGVVMGYRPNGKGHMELVLDLCESEDAFNDSAILRFTAENPDHHNIFASCIEITPVSMEAALRIMQLEALEAEIEKTRED